MSRRILNLKRFELLLLVVGLALTGFAVFTYLGGRIFSMSAVALFHARSTSAVPSVNAGSRNETQVDFSLWSPERIQHYKDSLAAHFDKPLALLTIAKINLEVPVYEGTSDLVLNRGVGRIAGTAPIGGAGNIGIAGHRDGFFRGLKDVAIGDPLEVETATGKQTYVVDSITLVSPSDVSVLKGGTQPALTLVTCYPFYFIGSAPQRYIVHASLKGDTANLNEPSKASLQATDSRPKETSQ